MTQKLSNGVRNVAFEGHNGEVRGTKVGEDELPESDSIFQRDSIYRFTVNPMFTSPDNSIDQRMPFKSAVYLPTNASESFNFIRKMRSFTSEVLLKSRHGSLKPPGAL